jgi:hypothetical protein
MRYTMGVGRQRKPGYPPITISTMTITVPTSAQIGAALETSARRVAIAIAIAIVASGYVYRAGYAVGRFVHKLSDWLARATHHPLKSATDVATAAMGWAERVLSEPETEAPPSLLSLLQAEILTDAEMASEITRYDAIARRKPAKATRVAVGA